MQYDYPAIFKPAEEGGYLVQFYDSENWFTEGDTLDEAVFMAEDVLNLMLLCYEEEGLMIPAPTPIDQVVIKENEIVKMIHADTERYAKMLNND